MPDSILIVACSFLGGVGGWAGVGYNLNHNLVYFILPDPLRRTLVVDAVEQDGPAVILKDKVAGASGGPETFKPVVVVVDGDLAGEKGLPVIRTGEHNVPVPQIGVHRVLLAVDETVGVVGVDGVEESGGLGGGVAVGDLILRVGRAGPEEQTEEEEVFHGAHLFSPLAGLVVGRVAK